jgi:hypothetical protein
MLMPDVNVLVYAHRADSPHHQRYGQWVTAMANAAEPFAISALVLHGFVRVVTNPRIFRSPSSTQQAFTFIDALLERPTCIVIRPGEEHWAIFRRLCSKSGIQGKLVADAVHAALAIESGCEWVTADTDFARFSPELRWRHL